MTILKREACLIGGQWVTGEHWIDVDNPATGRVIGRVPRFGRKETERAIAAADEAMGPWAAKTARERAGILRRYFDLIMAHQEELASILTEEQGKPLAEARGEVAYAASFIEWFAEEAKRVYGDVIPSHAPDKRIVVLKQPIGVVAAITPWNFPAAMITRKIGPALAAGCSVVVKPATQTPFTALALGALAQEAGLPAGLLNIVTGSSTEIGAALTESPVIRKLSFTGSTEVGAKLFAQCAPTIKKLSLELGGNAPFIVFDDADLDAAVAGAIQSKFRNAGQTCICANRIYVQSGIYAEFTARFTQKVAALKVGNGAEDGVVIGPLISAKAVQKVDRLVRDALAKGAKVLVGGAAHTRGGHFYQPTVLEGIGAGMDILGEEIFGPVAPLIRFETEAEVLAKANDVSVGLAAYVFTRDLSRTIRLTEGLQSGIVAVNDSVPAVAVAPFGGVKESGLGREGGRQGLDEFLDTKYVCIGLA